MAAFLRALATGMIGVLIAIYLAKRGFSLSETGTVVSAGLFGAASAAIVVTLGGNRLGSRRVLILLAILGGVGGLVVAFAHSLHIIVAAAFVGMVNGMGRDRGPSLIIDQAILPVTASDQERTLAFAWYNVLQDLGHALGGLAAGFPVLLQHTGWFDEVASLKTSVVIYAGIVGATAIVYSRLSRHCERRPTESARISKESRKILWRISSLFGLDSLAGGFLTAALLAYFFFERFGVSIGAVGALFFGARIANAISHLGAAWLARRIGLVNTMVFTHIPSSLLLITVAFAPNFPVAAVLFLLREGLVEMDVPTRQSYVMAVVRPQERMFASGITHLVRLSAWAIAPAFAGMLMQTASLAIPLYIGAGMKIAYDVALYVLFRRERPPEEQVNIHTC